MFQVINENFIQDLKLFVKKPNDFDIVKVSELLSNFDQFKNLDWDLDKFTAFNNLYEFTLENRKFKKYYNKKEKQRKKILVKVEKEIISYLKNSRTTIKNFIGINLGTEAGNNAILLLKKINKFLEKVDIYSGIKLIENLNEWKSLNKVKDEKRLSNEVVDFIINNKKKNNIKPLEQMEVLKEASKKNKSNLNVDKQKKEINKKKDKQVFLSSGVSTNLTGIESCSHTIQNLPLLINGKFVQKPHSLITFSVDFPEVDKALGLIRKEKVYNRLEVIAYTYKKDGTFIEQVGSVAYKFEDEKFKSGNRTLMSKISDEKEFVNTFGRYPKTSCKIVGMGMKKSESEKLRKSRKIKSNFEIKKNSSGIAGCSHTIQNLPLLINGKFVQKPHSLITFSVDFPEVDKALGLIRKEKVYNRLEVIAYTYKKDGTFIEQVGSVAYKFEDEKFKSGNRTLMSKISDEKEFVNTFGRYPKTSCKIVGMN